MIQSLAHLYLFGSKGSLMGVITSRQGKLWNFGGTHTIHKQFLTESTGSTWVGKGGETT